MLDYTIFIQLVEFEVLLLYYKKKKRASYLPEF